MLQRKQFEHALSAVQLGHDGLEQFIGLLFDELESQLERLDDQQIVLAEQRRSLADEQARLSIERARWETDQQHEHRVWQKRIEELEQERTRLLADMDKERSRVAELTQAIAEHQRQFADERDEWTAEIHQLRSLLEQHAPYESLNPRLEIHAG